MGDLIEKEKKLRFESEDSFSESGGEDSLSSSSESEEESKEESEEMLGKKRMKITGKTDQKGLIDKKKRQDFFGDL